MQTERNRIGRVWDYILQGVDANTALANTDREIEDLREGTRKEMLDKWDSKAKTIKKRNMKGTRCPFKPTIICQEGLCNGCTIFQDYTKGE
jgi:hypothetical protein